MKKIFVLVLAFVVIFGFQKIPGGEILREGHEDDTEYYRYMMSLEKETETPTTWADVIEGSDLYYLTKIICAESQNCGYQENLYVGSVVLNRVASDEFPDTIYDVIFQPGQYAPTFDGSPNWYKTPTEDNLNAAIYLLENGSVLEPEYVWQAQFVQGSYGFWTDWHYYGAS